MTSKPRSKLYRPKPLDPICVCWSDANHDIGWDGDPAAYPSGLAPLKDFGVFLRFDRDRKTGEPLLLLASCISEEDGTARRFLTIPRRSIKQIIPLSYPLAEPAVDAARG